MQHSPDRRSNDGGPDVAGGRLLGVSSVLLLLLAAAQGYVSFRAQYTFIHDIKGEHWASLLEALGLDCAAVIFALLALAQARLGRPAVTERVLNIVCVGGSLAMNAMSAEWGDPKSVAAWVLPALLYAAASDRLIAVVRRRALANRKGAEEDGNAYAAVAGLGMWLLRLLLAPFSTLNGFRRWVVETAPVAPGRRPVPPADASASQSPPSAGRPGHGGQPGRADRPGTADQQNGHRHEPPREMVDAAAGLGEPYAWFDRGKPVAKQPGAAVRGILGRNGNGYPRPPVADDPPSSNGHGPPPRPPVGATGGPAEPHRRIRRTDITAEQPDITAGEAAGGDGQADEPSRIDGTSKREALLKLYEAAGAAGDPRYMTRAGVGPLARELSPKAGYRQPQSASRVLHAELDRRDVPR